MHEDQESIKLIFIFFSKFKGQNSLKQKVGTGKGHRYNVGKFDSLTRGCK